MSLDDLPVPLTVRLPVGLEQPVAADVVRALMLAGVSARGDGRLEANADDLLGALAMLLSAADETLPARSGPRDVAKPPALAARVTPYRDGPYLLRGAFELTDQDGATIETRRATVALCRCGRSQLRPFCDGTHKLIGFQADSGPEPPPDPDQT